MASIKFDTTEICNSTYIPRFVKHESAPNRELSTLKLAGEDGVVLISERYGVKYITIIGKLTAASRSALDTAIDNFKELFSRKEKNLDISWEGSTRRYVATCESHNFDRDFFHDLFVPWSAEFIVMTGYGKDTSQTTALDLENQTATAISQSVTFAGSIPPEPIITINFDTVGNCAVLKIENTDTGDYIKIAKAFSAATAYIINAENIQVTEGGVEIDFSGLFPDWIIGSNGFKLTMIGSGSTLDQEQTYNAGGMRSVLYDDGVNFPYQAQSFILSESGWIDKMSFYVDKTGAPTGTMQFLIYSDNNGVPGTNLSGGGYEIAAANVPVSAAWTEAPWVTGNRPYLEAGRRYWILLNSSTMTGTDASNFYGWRYNLNSSGQDRYLDGKAMARPSASTSDPWEDGNANAQSADNVDQQASDMMFKIYYGNGAGVSHQLDVDIKYTKHWL